jgi:hypothetical protein
MKSTVFAVLLFCCAPLCHAARSYSVLAAPPRYHTVTGSIRSVCGVATRACTEILGASLVATCERQGDDWQIQADVTFIPYVYLPPSAASIDDDVVGHELDHIRDFQRDAEAYVRELAARHFPSGERCRSLALEEQAIFGARMRYFGQRSVRIRR